MHETVLAQSILQVAEREARERGGRRITRVHLKLGNLEGVRAEGLREAFGIAARGTIAEGAEIVIDAVPGRVECRACGATARIENADHRGAVRASCPECGGRYRVVDGRGVTVSSVRIRH